MGLFEAQVKALERFTAEHERNGIIQELSRETGSYWRRGQRLVLKAETALDLGNPSVGSVAFMIWAETPPQHMPLQDRVRLVGPDLGQLVNGASHTVIAPFGQAVVLRGNFKDDYSCYLEVKAALYDIALVGLTLRSLPSQSHLWCRVHRDNIENGFSFAHMGAAIINRLKQLDFVHQVDVLFDSRPRHFLEPLHHIASATQRVVGALIKRHEEEDAECNECEYADICDEREHQS